MKLKDFKISKQLNAGLGIIILLVVIMMIVSLVQSDSLWRNTKSLYDHPFVIQESADKANLDVMNIRLELDALIHENTDKKILEGLVAIETFDADINKQLETMRNLYLGPRSDIDSIYYSIVQWKPVRDEAIRLLREGNLAKAAEIVMIGGTSTTQAVILADNLQKVSDFASGKAIEFYLNAQLDRERAVRQMIFLVAIILILSITTGIVLRKEILNPLKVISAATENFRQGKLDARSGYESANEFGKLSNLFNLMTETVQTDILFKRNIANISMTMFRHDEIHHYPYRFTNRRVIFSK